MLEGEAVSWRERGRNLSVGGVVGGEAKGPRGELRRYVEWGACFFFFLKENFELAILIMRRIENFNYILTAKPESASSFPGTGVKSLVNSASRETN